MSDSDSDPTDSKESTENEEEETADKGESKRRKKRSTGYAWCGVDTEIDNSSTSFLVPRYDSNPNSNPVFGPRMQLYCKTGWMVALYSQNDVRGSIEDYDKYTFFELSSTETPGDVRIQCIENKLYLGMKKSGRLYGEVDPSKDNTIFVETLSGQYNNYLSRKWAHLGYYIGLRRSGKIKKGPKTAFGQKSIQFLPRRSNIQ